MISFEFLQESISSVPLLIAFSFAIGFVTFAVFPLIFAKIRVKPIKKETYNQICFIVGFVLFVLGGIGMVIPYVFWTWLGTTIGLNVMEKKGILVDLSNSDAEREAFRKADIAAAKIKARISDIRARERAEAEKARAEARAERLAERREREERLAEKRHREAQLAKKREKEARQEELKKKKREAERRAEYERIQAKEKRESDARIEKEMLEERRAQAKIGRRNAKEAERAAKKAKKSNVSVGFCRKCGTILHDNGRYCQKCGEKIRR